MPLDAINHKINQLSFFMFGYQSKIDGEDRFLYSPLGNLLLKISKTKIRPQRSFLLCFGQSNISIHIQELILISIIPFRLIFKLLLDNRLDSKLFAFEVAYLIAFTENVTEIIYEELVKKIIELRSLSNEDLAVLFEKDRHAYVNSAYEWDYYVVTF